MQTKRMLDKHGIEYTELDLQDHPDKVAEFTAQGLLAAPIVTTDIKIWSGFRHSKILNLVNYIQSQTRENIDGTRNDA